MTVYLAAIFILTGLGYVIAEKKQGTHAGTYYPIFVFVVLTLLTSLRYAIGFDYFAYRDIYEMMSGWTFSDILRTYWYEPFFFILCKLSSLPGFPFPVFLTFLNMFLLFTAIRFICHYSKLPWVSVYLYITLQFLAYDMNLIRQSLAISFFLLAYPYLKDRKLFPFTVLILVGGLFHNSLWFMYPLYFLLPVKLSWKSAGCLSAAALGVYLFFEPLFRLLYPWIPEKYALYEISYFWNASTFDYVIPAAAYGLLLYLFRNRTADPVSRSIYLNSALYHFLISLFITKHFILERFAVYPFVFSLLAIPDIIASYQPGNGEPENKYGITGRFAALLFLVFGGVYFLFAASKGFHNVYPYVSLFDRSISIPGV